MKNLAKSKVLTPNAAKIKETIDTPFSECQAEDPLKCRYHGPTLMSQIIAGISGSLNYSLSPSEVLSNITKDANKIIYKIDKAAFPTFKEKMGLVNRINNYLFKNITRNWAGSLQYKAGGNEYITIEEIKSDPEDDGLESSQEATGEVDKLDSVDMVSPGEQKKDQRTLSELESFFKDMESLEDEMPSAEEVEAMAAGAMSDIEEFLLEERDLVEDPSLNESNAPQTPSVSITKEGDTEHIEIEDIDIDPQTKNTPLDDLENYFLLKNRDLVNETLEEEEKAKRHPTRTQTPEPAQAGVTPPSPPPESTPAPLPLKDAQTPFLTSLEHDETKFPQTLTFADLDKGYVGSAGGHGGLHTSIVEIDGRKYICKRGKGKKALVIKNGYNADMAYRAGGIHAPDAKLYTLETGETCKLSEFIEGEPLIKVWLKATEEKRKDIRSQLLKGFPLDALFSNWDVLGTSPEEAQYVTLIGKDGTPETTHVAFDNVIMGKDGNVYRVDNDGAFAMSGVGNVKSTYSTPSGMSVPIAIESWSKWTERKWIDDYISMRANERNAGIFDRYSTADVFTAAGNIDLTNVEKALPAPILEAMAKPLFEMKQMTMRTVSATLAGIRNNEALSAALDASYQASKQGFREIASHKISFSNGGLGCVKGKTIPPYPHPVPPPPNNPITQIKAQQSLPNAAYSGDKISQIILAAAKTINYHAGYVQKDRNGNVLGNGAAMNPPDFLPNASKMAEFKKINREKLAKLAESDATAKLVLDYYDSVAISMANGFTQPVQEVKLKHISGSLPSGYKTQKEIDYDTNKQKLIDTYNKELAKYNNETLPRYNKAKHNWEQAEKAKIQASGGASLSGNFYDIADKFMTSAYDTYGVAQHNGQNIDFIEKGKDFNKFGGTTAGATTSNDSWTPPASKLKVLDLVMRGMTIDEIANIPDDDPHVNNGNYSGGKAVRWFQGEISIYRQDPKLLERELKAYSIFKGLQVLKLENEEANIQISSGENIQWIRKPSHTVGIFRRESMKAAKEYVVAPMFANAACASAGFQSNGAINYYPYGYEVPLWNIAYTYSDKNHANSKYSSHQGSEYEWVATLIGLPRVAVSSNTNASENLKKIREVAEIKEMITLRDQRLRPFATTLKDMPTV